jgi:hypothetical protein
MKYYTCEVRKPNNPRVAFMAVVSDSDHQEDIRKIIHENYGSHLLVDNIQSKCADGVTFQLSGDLVAVALDKSSRM